MSGKRTLSVFDVKEIIDLMKGDYEIPSWEGDYQFLCHPYTPTAYIGRTSLNGVGMRVLTDEKTMYVPRSKHYNWRWAKKKLDILKGVHLQCSGNNAKTT